MKKIANILILAGGDGDRFWPLKDKLLTPFLGKTLIAHLMEGLGPYGDKIHVVCSQANEKDFRNEAGDKAAVIVQEKGREGMAGAIESCKGKIKGGTLIVGNDLFDFSAVEGLVEAMDKGIELAFLAKKTDTYFPGGYLILENGRVAGIAEKPGADNAPSDLVKLVVDYVSDFEEFAKRVGKIQETGDDRYERALGTYLKEGKAAFVPYTGDWKALKYSWDVLSMMKTFLSGFRGTRIGSGSVVSDSAVITGTVHIGKNARIGDFAKIAGPCFIGDNAVIADYAFVRESHIGTGCLVGSSCEVARSYLYPGVSLHRNYVGDSVLGEKVLMGAGAVTANFRFDEATVASSVGGRKTDTNRVKFGTVVGAGSKIGVNTTIFPGVKVGAKPLSGPVKRCGPMLPTPHS